MKEEFEDVNQEDRQWPKEKGQKDKQQFTKDYTKKTKDRATRSPLKSGGGIRCSGREGS
jgi:hypothetical protein